MYELNDLEIEILNFINNNDSNRVINTAEIAGVLNAKTDKNIAPAIYKTVPVLIDNKLLQCSKGEYDTIIPLSLTRMGIKTLEVANNPEKIPWWKKIRWVIFIVNNKILSGITTVVLGIVTWYICEHWKLITDYISNLFK